MTVHGTNGTCNVCLVKILHIDSDAMKKKLQIALGMVVPIKLQNEKYPNKY